MILTDRRNLKFYKGTYPDKITGKLKTLRVSEAMFYGIAYKQYNNAFLRMMVVSPDVCPSLTKRSINAAVKQILDIIGHDSGLIYSCSIDDYFFTLFMGELQCQILN